LFPLKRHVFRVSRRSECIADRQKPQWKEFARNEERGAERENKRVLAKVDCRNAWQLAFREANLLVRIIPDELTILGNEGAE
jgi:hypothetical protein